MIDASEVHPESRTRQAARKLRNAGRERRDAHADGPSAEFQLRHAACFEEKAAELMRPTGTPTVRGGEVLAMPDGSGPVYEIQNTLRNPDQAAIDASVARTDLLLTPHADIVALATDAAASAKAENSLEKMLSHQLAGAHVLAMKALARALEFEKRQGQYGQGFQQRDSIEFARQANSFSRLMLAFQEGLTALQRLNSGASQTVTVRHVTVQAGAQAVIGNVKTAGRRTRVPARGRARK